MHIFVTLLQRQCCWSKLNKYFISHQDSNKNEVIGICTDYVISIDLNTNELNARCNYIDNNIYHIYHNEVIIK